MDEEPQQQQDMRPLHNRELRVRLTTAEWLYIYATACSQEISMSAVLRHALHREMKQK